MLKSCQIYIKIDVKKKKQTNKKTGKICKLNWRQKLDMMFIWCKLNVKHIGLYVQYIKAISVWDKLPILTQLPLKYKMMLQQLD